jgi:hypothetical protein
LTHDLLGGFMDSSSSLDAIAVFPEVTISGGLERELTTNRMRGVSEEDGLIMSAEGVGISYGIY